MRPRLPCREDSGKNARESALAERRKDTAHTPAARPHGEGLTATVAAADATALATYRADCREARYAPAQDPVWVAAWARHGGGDCLIARLTRGGRPVMALALEVASRGPFRIARFVGGSHANGNFPATTEDGAETIGRDALRALTDALAGARPDIDLLALQRQAHSVEGLANPLLALAHSTSPHIALAADLDGGFDAVLERANGNRKRKQHRAQARKLEAAGGFARRAAATPGDVDRMLDTFFAMKSERFARMGIANVFEADHVRRVFRALFHDALAQAPPPFVLHGLEVGGRLRAVTGSSRVGRTVTCQFSAIAEDELSQYSPGAFLFYLNIEDACAEGMAIYDFSVGDEHYKRQWSDIEQVQFDVFLPLTAKGRLLAAADGALARAKRGINASPRLRDAVKKLRAARGAFARRG